MPRIKYSLAADTKGTGEALRQKRIAIALAQDKAMRQAWLDEHPGEDPLPEHLCSLENPFAGQKRWCARALRWIVQYEKRAA